MCKLFRRSQKKQPDVVVNIIDEDYIVEFCYKWNVTYPIDRWWRDKHKVAFNSLQHRSISFVDMRMEFEEDMIFKKKGKIKDYSPNTGDWLEVSVDLSSDEGLTEEQKLKKYMDEFKGMDLSQYND